MIGVCRQINGVSRHNNVLAGIMALCDADAALSDAPPIPSLMSSISEAVVAEPKRKYVSMSQDKLRHVAARLESGASVSSIAAEVGVSERTVVRYHRKLMNNSVTALSQTLRGKHTGRSPAFSGRMATTLVSLVEQFPGASLDEIRAFMQRLFPTCMLSTATITRHLRGLGYSYKRVSLEPESRNLESTILRRATAGASLLVVPDEMLIFLDETGCSLQTIPLYGWAKRGSRCSVRANDSTTPSETLIAAVWIRGVVGYKLLDKPLTSVSFISFITDDVVPRLRELFPFGSKPTLIMDNLSVHRCHDAEPLLTSWFNVFFIPPYTPQLNAIEEVFHEWKTRVRRMEVRELRSVGDSSDQIQQAHAAADEGEEPLNVIEAAAFRGSMMHRRRAALLAGRPSQQESLHERGDPGVEGDDARERGVRGQTRDRRGGRQGTGGMGKTELKRQKLKALMKRAVELSRDEDFSNYIRHVKDWCQRAVRKEWF